MLFFLFPIFWIVLMSFQTNEHDPAHPAVACSSRRRCPTITALISGKLVIALPARSTSRSCRTCGTACFLARRSVALALLLGVPAAYAFARFKFRLGEDIAFTLLSFRFAPPLLVLLPLSLYFQQLGLTDTYVGLIWVYQLIALPLILWIVRGYFEDISPTSSTPIASPAIPGGSTFTRIALPLAGPGIAAAGLLAFIFCWNNFVFALILASADKQPVTVGALAFVTASGIQYGQIAAADRPLRSRRRCSSRSTPSAISSRVCRSAR